MSTDQQSVEIRYLLTESGFLAHRLEDTEARTRRFARQIANVILGHYSGSLGEIKVIHWAETRDGKPIHRQCITAITQICWGMPGKERAFKVLCLGFNCGHQGLTLQPYLLNPPPGLLTDCPDLWIYDNRERWRQVHFDPATTARSWFELIPSDIIEYLPLILGAYGLGDTVDMANTPKKEETS